MTDDSGVVKTPVAPPGQTSGLPGASSQIRDKLPHGAVPKPTSNFNTQPAPGTASSSTSRNEGSTASNLAALYTTATPRGTDSSIERWREQHRGRVKPTERERQLAKQRQEREREGEREKDKDKGKGKEKASVTPEYLGDSSDGNVSSFFGPTRNVGVGSTSRNAAGPSRGSGSVSISGSERSSLLEPPVRSAQTDDGTALPRLYRDKC